MNKSTLRQLIIAEMILADVNGRDHVSSKKRSMLEMQDKSKPRRLRSGESDPRKKNEPIMGPEKEEIALTPEQIEDLKLKTKETSTDFILGVAGFLGGIAGDLLAAPTFGISLVIGAIPDVVNGIRKVNRGDYFEGILDFLCAIPALGEGVYVFKGLSYLAKVARLMEIVKISGFTVKAIRLIHTIIKLFAHPEHVVAAMHAATEMLSGEQDRIEAIGAGTKSGDKSSKTSLGGIEYLQALVDKERSENSGVAESKNVSRLSLVDTLYGD